MAGTVVFTDIVGFTEFTAVRGDEEAVRLLTMQEEIVRKALPDDARIVKDLGDGLLLWFPDACTALLTCLGLQERFDAVAADPALPLWVRMGLHWGEPVSRGDDLVGHDVNVAARIMGLAGPGEVLLSAAVCEQIGERMTDVTLDELGPVVMKGIPEPVRLFRAQRASSN